ncbi:hypothetical protein RclHR1_00290023 [Rhizophagus clarus]|nr:hypothetical protein RclHR1_00290023 [Rhizophagus clarus]
MTVNSNPPGNWVCQVSPWGFVFTALLGCFFSVAIAFNLQVIFVHNYLSTRQFEKFYVIVPILLAFTLSIVPVIFDALGFDKEEVSCWYKHGNTVGSFIWQWTTLHGWIILSVLYCAYSVFTIIRRLHQANNYIKEMNRSSPNNTSSHNSFIMNHRYKRQLMINQAVKRIVLYPIVPIVTFLFNINATLVFFIAKHNIFVFQMLANAGTSSQGMLNALAFCFDPAMKKVWNECFCDFRSFFITKNDDIEKKFDDEKKFNNDNNKIIQSITTVTVITTVNQSNNENNGNGDGGGDNGNDNGSSSNGDDNGDGNNIINDNNTSSDNTIVIDLPKDDEYILALL